MVFARTCAAGLSLSRRRRLFLVPYRSGKPCQQGVRLKYLLYRQNAEKPQMLSKHDFLQK
jgi:hypothetical protein